MSWLGLLQKEFVRCHDEVMKGYDYIIRGKEKLREGIDMVVITHIYFEMT